MNGGPINTWSEYAKDEWERMGIHLAGDPLTVEPPQLDDTRGSVVGVVMLLLAFAAGVAVGWVVR